MRQNQLQELRVAELGRASLVQVAEEARGLITSHHLDAILSQIDIQLCDSEETETIILGQVFECVPRIEAGQRSQHLLPNLDLNGVK